MDGLGVPALEALERRRVLGVDGQQQPSSPLLCGERELAGGDEALLVREREIDAGLERPQRRRQAREADDGVQDDVRLGAFEQLGEVASDLRQRRQPVDGLRAGSSGDELELRVPGRRSRSPGDRSTRSLRGGRLASRRQCTALSLHSTLGTRRRRSTRPGTRRGSRRCGRARLRAPPAGDRSP